MKHALALTLAAAPLLASTPPRAENDAEFDHTHAAWTAVLEDALSDDGLVDYAGLRKSKEALDAYLAELEATTPEQHAEWSREERFAFWINAYNAYTIELLRDRGPVESIKELGGWFTSPWEIKFIPMPAFDPEEDGDDLMLDEIEHDILRPVFEDARVHAAINCASLSCPPLRAEAYQGAKLDEQLDDQTALWLADPSRNEIRAGAKRLKVSKIFDWFEDDFGGKDAEVVRWIAKHVADEALAKDLRARANDIDVRYLDYDWSINAQKGKR